MPAPRVSSQRPDPSRLWVRYSLRPWPGPAGFWTDVAEAALGRAEQADDLELATAKELDDVLYLPPVVAEVAARRLRLVESLGERGTPVMLQLMPGEEKPEVEHGRAFYDLLPTLLSGELDRLPDLPEDSLVVWPLIAGLTDLPQVVDAGLARLAASGVKVVRGLALVLPPAMRRSLAEIGGEAVFDRLFHAPPPSERLFAIRAAAAGLETFVNRPLPGGSRVRAHNRWLAGELAMIGELWLRVERPEGRGQAFFRAARLIDQADRDLKALSREGNLGIVSWLDPVSSEVIQQLVADGRSSLRQELQAEYLS